MGQNWISSWLHSQCLLCIVRTCPTMFIFSCSTKGEILSAFYINSNPVASILSGHGNKVAHCSVELLSKKQRQERQILTGSVAYPTDTHHCMALCHESQRGRFTEEMLPPSSCWASMAPRGKGYNVISRTKQSTGLNRGGSTKKQQGPTHLPLAQISSLMGASREISEDKRDV